LAIERDSRDALGLALERGLAGEGVWQFYNASPVPGLGENWKQNLLCQQAFRPEFRSLDQHGYSVVPRFDPENISASGVVFLLGRNRRWNEHMLASIWNQMAMGVRLIVVGNKTDGIGAIRKWFGGEVEITASLSKFHSIVFCADKQVARNLPGIEIYRLIDGYRVADGMFSSDDVDTGSELLVEYFDNRIKGKVADLGAGWGYLSTELAKRSENVTQIDLFEADHDALVASEENMGQIGEIDKAFHWIDVTTEFPKRSYDWVIMNPPFHVGRATMPELGKRFIEVAAATLPKGGRLLMVANKKLPYEKTLEENFRGFKRLEERAGFKVLEAVK